MKKLLFAVLLTLGAGALAYATLTNVPSHLEPYPMDLMPFYAPTANTVTINDDTDKAAFLIEVPASGTLTTVAFATGAITTGEASCPFTIETINTSGNPSGSLIVANASGTVTFDAADDNVIKTVSINSGTGVSVTLGQQVALVLARNSSGALNGAVFKGGAGGNIFYSIPEQQDYNVTGAGAWSKTSTVPMVMMYIDSVWYAPPHCMGGGICAIPTSETYASPGEKGIYVNLAYSVRAIGACSLSALAAASTIKYNLYSDPTGTPTNRATTNALDTDTSASTLARRHTMLFTTPYTMAASTAYVAAMSPQDATAQGLSYWTVSATYSACFPASSTGTYYARADSASGAFSETATRVPIMSLIVDQIDISPTGSSATPYFISFMRLFKRIFDDEKASHLPANVIYVPSPDRF